MPGLRLWGIRRSITLAVAAALLLVGTMVAAALWYGGWPSIKRDATVTPATLFDLLKLVFAVVAGIGGVAALVVAYRRQRVAEHTSALAEFAHQLAHAADMRAEATKALAEAADERAKIETDRNGVRLFNERFAKASEQLGSEKAAVRLAGVYAMAGLADDWPEGRQTCIDVLCAYLRMPYEPPPPPVRDVQSFVPIGASPEVEQKTLSSLQEKEVRKTVIRTIAARLRMSRGGPNSWRGCDLDFTGAILDEADFSRAKFEGGHVSFSGATFVLGKVSFAAARFGKGLVSFEAAKFLTTSRASFEGATFQGGMVSFDESEFAGGVVSFDEATFDGSIVTFDDADLTGGWLSFDEAQFKHGSVSFDEVDFGSGYVSFDNAAFMGSKVTFENAAFRGGRTHFREAEFSGGALIFDDAEFTGADVAFSGARFSGGRVDLGGASFGQPPTFDPWEGGRPPEGLILP
ncbi:pentapeptide repeat-containing protein [Micromonospora inyonensis]|uniref:pentapeptide repeat-containing protein n=1 Tax=Micromonospora inyonensis TaxID=47866 RepID=UPI00114CC74D|nr:pentapeptide repeat-containing protein [Micromonospora inyonensis]